jgi:hypothetical protein
MVRLTGQTHGDTSKGVTMSAGHDATGKKQQWVGMIVMLAALLVANAGTGHAWRGGGFHGGFHHGFHHGFPHAHARFFFGVGIGPFWPYAYGYPSAYAYPYAYPYGYPSAYPPVIVPSAPQISPPPPPPSWYYCDNPKGYYPYVQQCPGGWRQVPATP